MNVSPEQYVLASAFGGAVVAAIIAVITLIANARREHQRWILGLKFDAYYEYLAAEHAEHMKNRLSMTLFPYYTGEVIPYRDEGVKVTMLGSTELLQKSMADFSRKQRELSQYSSDVRSEWRARLLTDPQFEPEDDCAEITMMQELSEAVTGDYALVLLAMRKELKLGWIRGKKPLLPSWLRLNKRIDA